MATKSSTKVKPADTKKTTTSTKTAVKHDLLYIMSPSCGWCKKSDPVVEELIKEGHKITRLDVMNPEDQKRAEEVKQKYSAQCGTPLFIDAETGNIKCGFAEKDVLEKWAKGEEIPAPPRPKSPPPPPPQDLEDEKQIEDFKNAYDKWTKENDHLPKILPFDQILTRMKQARAAQAAGGGQPGQPGQPGTPNPTGIDNTQTRNTQFYYIVENNQKMAVMSEPGFITSLTAQYYVREQDGKLTKVVGDPNWNRPQQQPAGGNPNMGAPVKRPVQKAQPNSKEVKAKMNEAKKQAIAKKVKVAEKSKDNKKTIKGL